MSESEPLSETPSADAELVALIRDAVPLIDLRAPAEFARGAMPNATNLPLLSDGERGQVGRTYKAQGQTAAIALGERLVSGAAREARLTAWRAFIETHPGAWLYCWRGGLRSATVQTWLRAEGIDVPRVPGGFKALRGLCLEILDAAVTRKRWLVLGGRTGSGKTLLLQRTPASIDLEGFANHRGSAFGALPTPQPTLVDFENMLAQAFLRHEPEVLLLEDESRTIGRLAIPQSWHEKMQRAGLLILEADLEARSNNIRREYVDEALAAGVSAEALYQRFDAALDRIARRLGGARHKAVKAELRRSFEHGDHSGWIEQLLVWYYDPMYDYQLSRKQDRVLISGDADTLLEYLRAI